MVLFARIGGFWNWWLFFASLDGELCIRVPGCCALRVGCGRWGGSFFWSAGVGMVC